MTDPTHSDADRALAFAHPRHRVRALFHGHLVADSDGAVAVRQTGQPERFFFPRDSVEMEALVPTDFTREFPDFGIARFFTLYRDAAVIEHAAWCFESPAAGAEDLRGLVTFDPDMVQIEEAETQNRIWDAEAQAVSDYIRHTDSGSGRSQEAPWAATAALPPEAIEEDEEGEDVFTRGSPT